MQLPQALKKTSSYALCGSVFENFKNSAKKRLANFSQKYGDDLKRIEEVEYRIEFPINDSGVTSATIMGKVDVILKMTENLKSEITRAQKKQEP